MGKNIRKKYDVLNGSILILIPAVITGCLMFLFLWKQQYAPFGDNSFASMDARIQYLDFLAFLKDVLEGHNCLRYSFSIGLGQGGLGTVSYYLSSPFNLLLLLFDKSEIISFFDIAVALKMCLSAAAMSYYLQKRFENSIHACILVSLSCAYALMQYNVAQASNIMWLDGVYMLPLILLGVFYTVHQKRSSLLSATVALSVLFSWYSAGINCLFSVFWFGVEYILAYPDFLHTWGKNFRIASACMLKMAAGVLMSCAFFWPTVLAMRSGKGSSFDWGLLRPALRGNPLDTVLNYSLGGISSEHGGVSLFCGSLVLIGCIGFFLTAHRSLKITAAVLLGFLIMFYYWQPFFGLFSLLKTAKSYWYRYSYISVFGLIFIAALYYSMEEKRRSSKYLVHGGYLFAFLLCLLNKMGGTYAWNHILYSAVFTVISAHILVLGQRTERVKYRNSAYILLLFLTAAELFLNSVYLGKIYGVSGEKQYSDYQLSEEQQIRQILSAESAPFYRISQTSTRVRRDGNLTANYNEAMSFRYNGIASYTSSSSNRQIEFLNRAGYRKESSCITVVNTSILPVDSILAVKYLLSSYAIPGYTKMGDSFPAVGEKQVYKNQYCMPPAFIYHPKGKKFVYNGDPFLYINQLYSELFEGNMEVFTPIPVKTEEHNSEGIVYSIEGLKEKQALYGNLLFKKRVYARMDVNGIYDHNYGGWLSPSVFCVPFEGSSAKVTVSAEDPSVIRDSQFYVLDLEKLADAVKQIDGSKVKNRLFENGHIIIDVEKAGEGEALFTSVPYDKGWRLTVNGKLTDPVLFDDTLMTVPLTRGNNIVEFQYQVPGLRTGICMSAAGFLLLLMSTATDTRKIKKGCNT